MNHEDGKLAVASRGSLSLVFILFVLSLLQSSVESL
jgi:hypothetical protein